jgi:transforming growth factor-beta-induced protein
LGETEETIQGDSIAITKNDEGVTLNGNVTVTTADVTATNGLIHVIDNALLPPALRPQPTIAEIAIDTNDLSILVAAQERAPDLSAAAGDPEAMLIVFAPTNAAFEQLLADSEDFNRLDDIPDDVLTTIQEYHILGSIKKAADLTESEETLSGDNLSIDKSNGVVINGEVTVTTGDIMAANGVVHLIAHY